MSLFSRMAAMIQAKISRLLDSAENPAENLDYSYEKQLKLLQDVKRNIADVVTSKKQLQFQVEQLEQNMQKLDQQARAALAAGREDLARLALEKKQAAKIQLEGLGQQVTSLEAEQSKLTQAEARLSTKVEAFRTRKETMKAQYQAAEAQVRIGEAFTGLSEEMADVNLAVQRVEEKTLKLKARASAIDELVQSGTLDDVSFSGDALDRELSKVALTQGVDNELERMKLELGQSAAKPLPGEQQGS